MSEEITEQAEAVEAAPDTLLDAANPTLEHGEFFISEGIKGTGEVPDWYKADKYKSVSEQAKAYGELEKKFGSFTGAPKDGYSLPEGFDSDDELAKQVIEFGTESNLSQDGFDKLMTLAAAQAGVTEQVSKEQELGKLGENAGQRIKQVEHFLKEKAGDDYEAISGMITNADSVMLVESMIKMMAPPKLPIDGYEVEGGVTWADIEVLMYKKDDNGNLLRSVDRAHELKIQQAMKEFGGDKQHSRVMG